MPRRFRHALLCGCLSLGLAGSLPRARAEEIWRLRVLAPQGADCATTADLARSVEDRAGRSVFTAKNVVAQGSLEVTIEKVSGAGSFRAHVQSFDPSGEPSGERVVVVKAASCRELDAVLTLIISSLVGIAEPAPPPSRPAREPRVPSQPVPEPASPVADSPPSAAPELESNPESPATPADLTIGLGVRMQDSLLPELAYGPSAYLQAAWGVLELYGELSFLPARSAALPDIGYSRAFAAFAEVGGCAIVARPFGSGRLGLCAELGAGALWIETLGLYRGASNREPVLFAAPVLHMATPLVSSLRLGILAGLAMPLVSQRFSYIDTTEMRSVYHEVGIGFWLRVGIGLAFGT